MAGRVAGKVSIVTGGASRYWAGMLDVARS